MEKQQKLQLLLDVTESLIETRGTGEVKYDQDVWFCGTHACLAGHFILRHPNVGLILQPPANSNNDIGRICLENSTWIETSFEALEFFFEITEDQATYLFNNGTIITLDHRRDFIKGLLRAINT